MGIEESVVRIITHPDFPNWAVVAFMSVVTPLFAAFSIMWSRERTKRLRLERQRQHTGEGIHNLAP